jgi:hypothetical protein
MVISPLTYHYCSAADAHLLPVDLPEITTMTGRYRENFS